MKFRQFGLIAVALCVPASMYPQKPTKMWTADLNTNTDFANRSKLWEGLLKPPFIHFVSDSQIICDFYDGQEREFDLSVPLSGYHVLAVDASTGGFGKELTFQAFDDDSRALPTDDGGFIVFTGRDLRKYDRNFLPNLTYPTPREPLSSDRIWLVKDRLWVDISPSGKTIMLYYRPHGENRPVQWTWIRTNDFRVIRNIPGPPTLLIRASEDAAIFNDASDEELFSESNKSSICEHCDAHFLTDGLLFLDKRKSYSIQTTGGKQLTTGRLKMDAKDLAIAASATRLAYITGGYVGWGFPIATHYDNIVASIVVRDWTTNEVIAQIPLEEAVTNPSDGLNQTALALSPDGQRLVVLVHHVLTLYRLP